MQMDLHDIFDSITPENIKSIPVVRTAMQVFIDTLERNSQVAKNITNLFDVSEMESDSPMMIRSKRNLKKGLYLTYIYTLWMCINDIVTNQDVRKDLEKFNYSNSSIYNDIETIINTEFISAHRQFSQRVGTRSALYYIYSFAKYLETGQVENDLEITEGNPFVIYYEGSLGKRIFNHIVKPLAHPLGWVDIYTTIITIILQDYFGIEIFNDFSNLMLKNNEKYVVFISDNDIESVYKEFRNKINPVTKQPYTDAEIAENVMIFTNRVVGTYDYYFDEDGYMHRTIVFTDQMVLAVDEKEGKIYYTNYEDYLDGFKNPEYEWNMPDWQFIGTLISGFRFLYYDTMEPMEKTFEVTKWRDDGTIGDSAYYEDSLENCFKVLGDIFEYVPGIDESTSICENDEEVNTELAKFNLTVPIRSFYSGYLNIYDDISRKYRLEINQGESAVTFNTYNLNTDFYKIEIEYHTGEKYYIRTNNANNFDPKIKILSVEVSSDGMLHIKYQMDKEQKVWIEIKTSKQTTMMHNTYSSTFDLYWSMSTSIGDDNYYKVTVYTKDDKGHPRNHCVYETNIFNQLDDNYIGVQYHTDTPDWNFDISKIDSTDMMENLDSYDERIPCKIAEKRDGTFTPEDEWIDKYIVDGVLDRETLKNKFVTGNIIEGCDYNNSFWYDTEYLDEETFIYKGWKHTSIGTSDFIITDSTRYVQEEFEIIPFSSGFYIHTLPELEANNIGRYFFTTDLCYLYTHEVQMPEEHQYYQIIVNVINGSIDIRYSRFSVNQNDGVFTQEMYNNIINNITPDEGYTEYEINLGGLSIGDKVQADATITVNFIQDELL